MKRGKPKQSTRLMYIHALVREGNCPAGRVLQERLGVALRTIYRDLAVLRKQLHAPLAYNAKRRVYEYTIPNWNIF